MVNANALELIFFYLLENYKTLIMKEINLSLNSLIDVIIKAKTQLDLKFFILNFLKKFEIKYL